MTKGLSDNAKGRYKSWTKGKPIENKNKTHQRMSFVFCSPHYNALEDETESRCCNFKTPMEKQAERQLEPHELPHFRALRAPKKVQFLAGIALIIYGLLLVFSPEYMAYHLFMGKEYMQEQGFMKTELQRAQEVEAQNHLEQLQMEEDIAKQEGEASNTLAMSILESLLGPDVNPTKQQMFVASQAAKEAELQLKHLEQLHDEVQREARAKGASSIPFQQFSRLYGAVVLAIGLHGVSTVTILYHVNCSLALFYIGFYGAQSVAMLMAVMPVVKVDNMITTVISSSWLLKLLMITMALMCALWVWLYQRLRVAGPLVPTITHSLDEAKGEGDDTV